MRRRTVHAILTRHFLRRFLENDLISPDADRLQLLVVVGAGVLTTTLFIATFMSFNYIVVPHTPAQAAVSALNDRFFYIALSMVVVALVAVSQWDSLVVDVRDAAILEPLPIQPVRVRRAKLTAVAILGGAVAIAVNIVPSVIFPWLLVFHQRVTVAAMAALVVTHLAVTIAAAGAAYLAAIALRETLATVLPARAFARVSPWVQGTLIVLLGTALLLIPPTSSETSRRGFDGARAFAPPSWFVGVYEMAVGGIIADGPRGRMTARQARADAIMSAVYARHRPQFPVLARRAGMASAIVVLVTTLAYMSNARGFSVLTSPPAAAVRRRWRWGRALATALIARDSTVRAGFFFALAAMWRSNVHRLTLACAGAVGLAMCLIALSGIDVAAASRVGRASPRLLSVQPLLFGVLLVGFRHAIRVPVELRAGWGFQLAWREHERRFLAGVRRAALVGLVIPALAATLPLFVFVLGPQLAFAHAALGLAGAVVVLEALLVGYTKVPFTCTYLPNENMKALGPIFFVAFLIGASVFAGMEGAALADPSAAVPLLVVLAIAFGVLRVAALRIRRPELVDFHEAPMTTQRLGLHT
jgi:hypothetical protein